MMETLIQNTLNSRKYKEVLKLRLLKDKILTDTISEINADDYDTYIVYKSFMDLNIQGKKLSWWIWFTYDDVKHLSYAKIQELYVTLQLFKQSLENVK
jgi:hypothetical protein